MREARVHTKFLLAPVEWVATDGQDTMRVKQHRSPRSTHLPTPSPEFPK